MSDSGHLGKPNGIKRNNTFWISESNYSATTDPIWFSGSSRDGGSQQNDNRQWTQSDDKSSHYFLVKSKVIFTIKLKNINLQNTSECFISYYLNKYISKKNLKKYYLKN